MQNFNKLLISHKNLDLIQPYLRNQDGFNSEPCGRQGVESQISGYDLEGYSPRATSGT